MTIIIIDGADRTGKSHIVSELEKLTKIPRRRWDGIRNFNIKSLDDPIIPILDKFSIESFLSFLPLCQNFIEERGYMSIYVYGKYFKRKQFINSFEKLEKKLMKYPIIYVMLYCSEEELKKRFERAPDRYINLNQAIKIQQIYFDFFNKSKIKKIKIDTTSLSPRDVAKKIFEFLKQKKMLGE